MATVDLTTKYLPYVDELFEKESKKELVTNQDFKFEGAKTVKVYRITTASMNDYDRNGETITGASPSRYGSIEGLDATTQTMTLRKDRSFTFAIDKLDQEETQNALEPATALARQQREVIVPEIDSYVFGQMVANAGTKPTATALTASNIYEEVLKASLKLDDELVPDTDRYLIVTPAVYQLIKQDTKFIMQTNIAQEYLSRGVIAMIDGVNIMKVPASRLPAKFGFMMCHPSATVAPTKLEEFKIHTDPQFISGSLVEGRICYDAFILDNKKMAIYYQALPA